MLKLKVTFDLVSTNITFSASFCYLTVLKMHLMNKKKHP